MSGLAVSRPDQRRTWAIATRVQQAELDLDSHDRMIDSVLTQAREYTDEEIKLLAREVGGLREETKENTRETKKLRDSLTTLTLTVAAAAFALCGSLVLVAVRLGGG